LLRALLHLLLHLINLLVCALLRALAFLDFLLLDARSRRGRGGRLDTAATEGGGRRENKSVNRGFTAPGRRD